MLLLSSYLMSLLGSVLLKVADWLMGECHDIIGWNWLVLASVSTHFVKEIWLDFGQFWYKNTNKLWPILSAQNERGCDLKGLKRHFSFNLDFNRESNSQKSCKNVIVILYVLYTRNCLAKCPPYCFRDTTAWLNLTFDLSQDMPTCSLHTVYLKLKVQRQKGLPL